jgi:hypothetical protein
MRPAAVLRSIEGHRPPSLFQTAQKGTAGLEIQDYGIIRAYAKPKPKRENQSYVRIKEKK